MLPRHTGAHWTKNNSRMMLGRRSEMVVECLEVVFYPYDHLLYAQKWLV